MGADGTFHRSERATARGAAPVGPSSNTGQKSPGSLSAPIIDWCTAVLDSADAIKFIRGKPLTEVVRELFHVGEAIAVGPVLDRPLNFYQRSATMVDATGTVAGKIAIRDDGALQIILNGQGCQSVPYWPAVADNLDNIDGRLSRCDIAVDDLTGETFDIQTFLNLYEQDAFTMNGRPPTPLYVDDMGSNKGCSFYIGQKGHKQLNVYEKGKQLGDPESPHVRCELRLYAKRLELPNDALRNPAKYFASAYPALVAFVVGEAERLEVKEIMVNASAKAMVRFLYQQAGTALQLVMDALGDEANEYIMKNIVRPGRPGRFKRTTGDLAALVRTQLSQSLEKAA